MNTIDPNIRSPFFPQSKDARDQKIEKQKNLQALQRNTLDRAKTLKQYGERDAKINIPDGVKDFARIKKAVDAAPPIDNSDKIARLKNEINSGKYKFDYDAMADKLLSEQF